MVTVTVMQKRLTNLHKMDLILLACSLFEKRSTRQAARAHLLFWQVFFPTHHHGETDCSDNPFTEHRLHLPFIIPACPREGTAWLEFLSQVWRWKMPLSEAYWSRLNHFPACVSPAWFYFNAVWRMLLTLNLLNLRLTSPVNCIRRQQRTRLCRIPGSRPQFIWYL